MASIIQTLKDRTGLPWRYHPNTPLQGYWRATIPCGEILLVRYDLPEGVKGYFVWCHGHEVASGPNVEVLSARIKGYLREYGAK